MTRPRILIVEDDAIVAEDIRNRLIQLGHDVVAIEDSGEDGVRSATSLRPDLVLMDVRLSGLMGGVEAGQRIQASLASPVVYVTATPDPDRMLYYVTKPLSTRALASAITKALRTDTRTVK